MKVKRRIKCVMYMRVGTEEQAEHRKSNIQEACNKIEVANKIMNEFIMELQTPFYRRKIILKI